MADQVTQVSPGESGGNGSGFGTGMLVGLVVIILIILALVFFWPGGGTDTGTDTNIVEPGAGDAANEFDVNVEGELPAGVGEEVQQ